MNSNGKLTKQTREVKAPQNLMITWDCLFTGDENINLTFDAKGIQIRVFGSAE